MIVVYLILFFIQLFSPQLLPIGLYIKVGIVSLVLSFMEFLKGIVIKESEGFLEFKQYYEEIVEMIYSMEHNLKETQLDLEFKKIRQKLQVDFNKLETISRLCKLTLKAGNVIVVLNSGSLMVVLFAWSYIAVPDGIYVQSIIYALSLLTFVFTLSPKWFDEWYSKRLKEEKESMAHTMKKIKKIEKKSEAFVSNPI